MLELIKIFIIYVIGIIVSYLAFKYILDKDIVSDYDCQVAAICWIIIVPLGIVMSIIEIIRQKIINSKRILEAKKCFGKKQEK